MYYTPPSGNAVDFKLQDFAYTPPAGNAVDFVIPPHPVANTNVDLSPIAVGVVHLPIAYGAATLSPIVAADANHMLATAAATLSPIAAGSAKHGWYCDASPTLQLLASGSSAQVYKADAAATLPILGAGSAAYVHQASGAATLQPVGTGSAQIPAVTATANPIIVPLAVGVAIRGAFSVGSAIISPIGSARVNALHRCGSVIILSPIAAAQATHIPPEARPIRCRGMTIIRPIGQGQASV